MFVGTKTAPPIRMSLHCRLTVQNGFRMVFQIFRFFRVETVSCNTDSKSVMKAWALTQKQQELTEIQVDWNRGERERD
jgi:hypothetical protein